MQIKRYFFECSYNGASFHGWQKQKNAISVQETIENRLSKIYQTNITIVGSGRTDIHVHAKRQVFHVDFDPKMTLSLLKFKLNTMLPMAISINDIWQVNPLDHARFTAKKREYRYFIHQKKNPFLTGLSTYFQKPIDLNLLNEASLQLISTKDFESFSKVKTDVTTFDCEITDAIWSKTDDQIQFTIRANRFLRSMVRAIVGTLLDIGTGRKPIGYLQQVLDAKNRQAASSNVPAEGLYLWDVTY